MPYILVEPLTTPSGTHAIGTIAETQSAHLLKSAGGILLPYDPGANGRINGLCSVAMRAYAGMATLTNVPNILPGPIVFLNGPCKVHWALKVRAPEDLYQGRVSILSSTSQFGTGVIRVPPSDTESIDLADIRGSGDYWWIFGSFHVRPMQNGFAAFDYYLMSPFEMFPVWTAVTLVSE